MSSAPATETNSPAAKSNTAIRNVKALKEKSASSASLKTPGPFAAIRECELNRQKKTSLELNQGDEF